LPSPVNTCVIPTSFRYPFYMTVSLQLISTSDAGGEVGLPSASIVCCVGSRMRQALWGAQLELLARLLVDVRLSG